MTPDMPGERLVRRSFPDALRDQLEPLVAQSMGTEHWGLAEVDRAVALSQAISLRRLADSLGTNASLEEVFNNAINSLANTLAEHRMYSK